MMMATQSNRNRIRKGTVTATDTKTTDRNNSFDYLTLVLVCLYSVLGLMIAFLVSGCIIGSKNYEIKKAQTYIDLKQFLAVHGNIVTILATQDETYQNKSGKHITTVDYTWVTCKFTDDYVIEIKRYHGCDTCLIPRTGEVWQVAISGGYPRLYLWRKLNE